MKLESHAQLSNGYRNILLDVKEDNISKIDFFSKIVNLEIMKVPNERTQYQVSKVCIMQFLVRLIKFINTKFLKIARSRL